MEVRSTENARNENKIDGKYKQKARKEKTIQWLSTDQQSTLQKTEMLMTTMANRLTVRKRGRKRGRKRRKEKSSHPCCCPRAAAQWL